ncbi:MAG: cell division protein SepF [Clostridia bacterium]|nr:cell division protein SepF [Clostridia bacterium]
MGLFDSLKEKLIGDNVEEEIDEGLYPIDEEGEVDGEVVEDAQTGSVSREGISGAIELKVVKPERYGNVKQIADHLLNHRTVVLNLESTNKETAKRLLDFLSGVAYSIDGQLKRVATNTFVITPCNVDVSGEQMRATTGEDTGNFTTTFGVSGGEGGAAPAGSDTLY